MPRLKRSAFEADLDHLPSEPPLPREHADLLKKLRNMWEFASFMQYIYLFGKAVKIDDNFDMEDLEAECLRPQPSVRLAQIGLQLLKYVSSHRGLTLEIFDEYTRRQFVAKAPHRNPYGTEEEPAKFDDFDIDTKIRVLLQLSTWTLGNPDRMRGLMPDDEDQLSWRMEPLGWDKDDNAYYVLDDNRLYCRTEEPIPKSAPPKPKPKPTPKPKIKARPTKKPAPRPKGTRSSKRLKLEEEEIDETGDADDVAMDIEGDTKLQSDTDDESKVDVTIAEMDTDVVEIFDNKAGYGFTTKTWSLIAITLEEYQEFLSTIFRTRDPNEKILRKRLEEEVMPIIEKRADQLRQKELKKLRDIENMHKMSMAKRSSRLAGKAEREKEERDKREEDEKKERELKMAREEEEKQRRLEESHESRRLTREQRLKDREVKRILHEEELAKIKELEDRAESQGALEEDAAGANHRISARQAKTQREQHQLELDRLAEEEEGSWYFDCARCGMHGENLDDGGHSVACDKCGVWQHSHCLGITPKQAESEDFVFVCRTCKRKEEEAKRPKIPPIKLGKNPSTSPESPRVISEIAQHRQTVSGPESARAGQMSVGPPPVHLVSQPPNDRLPPVSNFAPQARQPNSSSPQSYVRPPSREHENRGGYAVTNGHHVVSQGHQRHHHYAHNQAVSAAGGHPVYHPSYPVQHVNGYGLSSSPGPTQGHHAVPQQQPHSPPAYDAAHAVAQSSGARPPSRGPLIATPVQNGSHEIHQLRSPTLQQSPRTTLPPPQARGLQPAQSPTKAPSSDSSTHGHGVPAPPLLLTPQNGVAAIGQPRQVYAMPSLVAADHAGRATGDIAKDGMSGPWPQGSEAIPKKHDQSPGLGTSPGSGLKTTLPPMTTLAPSPSQATIGGARNIPVKKQTEALSPMATSSSPLAAPTLQRAVSSNWSGAAENSAKPDENASAVSVPDTRV